MFESNHKTENEVIVNDNGGCETTSDGYSIGYTLTIKAIFHALIGIKHPFHMVLGKVIKKQCAAIVYLGKRNKGDGQI